MLTTWLRDARAMEEQSGNLFEASAGEIGRYAELRPLLEEHAAASRQQARALGDCIARRGGSTPALNEVAGRFTAAFVTDHVMKAIIALPAFVQVKIAAYRILAAVARNLADAEARQLCEAALEKEQAAAERLNAAIPQVTELYLAEQDGRAEGKA